MMSYREILGRDREKAAQLISKIDTGERQFFECPEKNPDFERAVCARMCGDAGALFACIYAGKLRITIAFEDDLPECAAEETEILLKELIAREKRDAAFWLRNENIRLRAVVEAAFHTKSDYQSREMSVSKVEFTNWKEPHLLAGMRIAGYDPALLTDYLLLLERAMAHVIAPGTTPYLDARNDFAIGIPELAAQNRFHALWAEDVLAGVCFSRGRELDTIALNEPYRRRGGGYALLHAGLAGAFENVDGDIRLYVVDENAKALGFYRHIGMRETGHSARYTVKFSRFV
jgi:GNAT superfamily N-acetyltransferase